MADKVVKTVLTYSVDEASVKKATASASAVEASLGRIRTTADKSTKDAERSITRLSAALDSGRAKIASGAGDYKSGLEMPLTRATARAAELKKELEGAAAAAGRVTIPLPPSTTGFTSLATTETGPRTALDILKGIRKTPAGIIGSQGRMLPSVQIPGLGIGTDQIFSLIRLGGIFTELGVSLTSLGVAAGIAAPFIVGVIVAFKGFNDQLEGFKQSLSAALDAQDAYYEALAKGTTVSVRGQLDTLKAGQSALEQQINETKGAIRQQYQNLLNSGDNLNPLAAFATNLSVTQLRDQLSELEKQFTVNKDTVARYTEGLVGNAFALNDMIEAEKRLNAARMEGDRQFAEGIIELSTASADALRQQRVDLANQAALDIRDLNKLNANDPADAPAREKLLSDLESTLGLLNQISNTFLPIQQRADDVVQSQKLQGSSAQELSSLLDKTTEDYNRLSVVITGLNAVGAGTPETLAGLNDQLSRDNQLIQEIVSNYLPLARAREAEIESLKKIEGARKDLLKAQEDIVRAQVEHARATEEAYANAADAETKAFDSQQYDLSEAARKAGIDRAEAQKKSDEKALADKEDYEKKRAKIERDFARSSAEAIQDRDAVALDKARTKRKDDLADLSDSYKDQKKATKKALDDQLKTINDNLAEQQRVINHRYDEQFKAAEQALQKALDIEAYKYAEEGKIRKLSLDTALAYFAQFRALIARTTGASASVGGVPANVIYDPNAGITTQQGASAAFAAYQHSQGVHGFANGGMVPRTGLIYAHAGERVLTVRQTRQYNSGGITINGYGMNRKQVLKQVERALRQYDAGQDAG